MGYGNASARPDKKMSQAQAKTQLMLLLENCTDGALAGFTVDRLLQTHNVDRKTAEYGLLIARQRRAARE